MAELGFLGASLEGYGCAGMSDVEYGLICQELERGDSAIRSFISVQGSLVMWPILTFGSEEQKDRWLPALQQGKAIGCFGLTEPEYGSNPAGMLTTAVRVADSFILNGEKTWITNGTLADTAVVWAKLDGEICGFLVERGTPGFTTSDIHGKWSMRASVTSSLSFADCRIPAANALPGATGINNHMGSRITGDPVAMAAVLEVVAARGLFFLDSRTTKETVAYDLARKLAIPAARRDVFLDEDPAPAAVGAAFDRLLALAREKGAAIAIGHPHEVTLALLERRIPEAKAAGYEIVPLSFLLERSESLP